MKESRRVRNKWKRYEQTRLPPEETFRIFGAVVMIPTLKSVANPSANSVKEIRSSPVNSRLQNASPKMTKMKPTSKILAAPKTRDEADATPILLLSLFPLAKRNARYPGTNGRTQGEAKTLIPKISEINNEGDSDTGREVG